MAISLKDKFKKANAKSRTISTADPTPDFWLSTGNKLINKIISGRYDRGFPQGRIAGLAGLSGTGKSFLIANAIAQAQKQDYFVLVADSENALDSDYLSACGVDTESDDYLHFSISTFSAALDGIRQITEDYQEARTNNKLGEMKKLLIVCDSLDFMFTDSMIKKFEEEGEMGNDQGLHARKMKQFLQTLVSEVKFLPAIVLCTKQVYMDQTPNAQPPVKMAESVKYPMTQLLLITRLLDGKDSKAQTYSGIKLRVFGWKTRGCKPFQRCELVIPYDEGMDEYEGMLQVAVQFGIVDGSGSWFTYGTHKWQGADKWRKLDVRVKEEIFQQIIAKDIKVIDIADGIDEAEFELESGRAPKKKDNANAMKDAVANIKKRQGESVDGEDEAG
jgi:recombination protein RecA